MNRSLMFNCPRTPAPMRNTSFLMSAAAVLETPTLLRKSAPVNVNCGKENEATLQPPSAASSAAMQFLMFNQQMQSAAAFNVAGSASCGTPFQRNVVEKSGIPTNITGFNFAVPSVPDSTTTVTTQIVENLQIENRNMPLKRKHEDNRSVNWKKPPSRDRFDLLPLKPKNQPNGGNKWTPKSVPAILAGPSKKVSPLKDASKVESHSLRILTGSVEHILKLTRSCRDGGSPLVEVFANVLSIKAGTYECEKIVLLRNQSGPVMQGVFYEIDFRIPAVHVGDLVRCVGRLSGGSRLQILKMTPVSAEEERMGQRLQTVSGFVVAVKR